MKLVSLAIVALSGAMMISAAAISNGTNSDTVGLPGFCILVAAFALYLLELLDLLDRLKLKVHKFLNLNSTHQPETNSQELNENQTQ